MVHINIINGGFLKYDKYGYPLNFIHLFENSIFHELNSSYTPMYGGIYLIYLGARTFFCRFVLEDLEKIWFNGIVFTV